MEAAQKHLGMPVRRLIAPFKNRFAFLIHSFQSLLENNPGINYLYGSVENIPKNNLTEAILDRLVCHKHCGDKYAAYGCK